MTDIARQQANIDIVRSTLDNARAGRLGLAEPFFSDDFVLYHADSLPFGGAYHGWGGYKEILRRIREFWSGTNKLDSREFIPYGDDKVIIHFTVDGRIAKNGQHVQMPVLALWELRDRKIIRIRPFFFDTKRIVDLSEL